MSITETAADQPPARWTRADYRGLLLCAAIGLLLAVLPHFATLAKYGTARYLADGDDVLYLAVARLPAQGENLLRDPFSRPDEAVPSLYAWLQFVPLAKLSSWLGIPLILINLVWRIVGGLFFGAALFVLFRMVFSGRPGAIAWSVGCALVCLSDAGFSTGRMLVENLSLAGHMWHGTTPLLKADALPQYRVVTPLLNLPFLLLLAAVLLGIPERKGVPGLIGPDAERPDAPRSRFRRGWILAVAGSILLAVCFYLYFFFWTAAVAGIALFLAINLFIAWRDPLRRRTALNRAKVCALVLAGGVLLGAPQVYSNAKTFADPHFQPILQRLSRGRDISADHAARFVYLRNLWLWLKLGIGAAGILLFRFRRLTLLWCLTLAGYALACSAIFTGLEFENFHWSYVHAAFGEVLVLATIGLYLAPRGRNLGRLRYVLWLVPVGLLLIAAAWRPYEALKAPEAVWNSQTLGELRPLQESLAALGPDCTIAGPKEANLALLFTRCGQLYQQPYTSHNSVISDDEVTQRHALNAWLQSKSLAEYLAASSNEPIQVGPSSNPVWQPDAVARARGLAFQAISADPMPFLARYRPNALLLPLGQAPPAGSGAWRLVRSTNKWSLWTTQ